MPSPTHAEIQLGEAIRAARVRARLTQAELGAFADADRYSIANLENGRFTTQIRRLLAVLDAVGLELSVTPRSHRLASMTDPGSANVDGS